MPSNTSNRSGAVYDPSFPRHEWTCVAVEDLGAVDAICEWCGVKEIRYVHEMQHASTPQILRCGCVCAGRMERDSDSATAREATMRTRAQRRLKWTSRRWKETQKGWRLKADGYMYVVFERGAGRYGAMWKVGASGKPNWIRGRFATFEAAALALFDARWPRKVAQAPRW